MMVYGATFSTWNTYVIPVIPSPTLSESDYFAGGRKIIVPGMIQIREGILGEGKTIFNARRKVFNQTIPSLEHRATIYMDFSKDYGPESKALINGGDALASQNPDNEYVITLRNLVLFVNEGGLVLAKECRRLPKASYHRSDNLSGLQFYAIKNPEDMKKLHDFDEENLETFIEKLKELWHLG